MKLLKRDKEKLIAWLEEKDNGKTEAGLMDIQVTNDLGMPHIIGSWWRNFKITKYVQS